METHIERRHRLNQFCKDVDKAFSHRFPRAEAPDHLHAFEAH